jgi:hypothetical protein
MLTTKLEVAHAVGCTGSSSILLDLLDTVKRHLGVVRLGVDALPSGIPARVRLLELVTEPPRGGGGGTDSTELSDPAFT